MKKIIIFVLVLNCVFALAGCRKTHSATTQTEENPVNIMPSEAGTNDFPQHIDFDVQYIRTDGYIEGEEYPKVFWITNTTELNEYCESADEKYYLGSIENPASDQTIGFIDAVSKYDDDFFEKNDLILVVLEEPSGSIRHNVSDVLMQPSDSGIEEYFVQPVIERQVPEAGTDDMAQWHIVIEVGKEYGATKSKLQEPIIK